MFIIINKINMVNIDNENGKTIYLPEKMKISVSDFFEVGRCDFLLIIATSFCDVVHKPVGVGMQVNI